VKSLKKTVKLYYFSISFLCDYSSVQRKTRSYPMSSVRRFFFRAINFFLSLFICLCMKRESSPTLMLMGYKSFSKKKETGGIHMKMCVFKAKFVRVSNGQGKLYSNKRKISIIFTTTSCRALVATLKQ
jgi:hypothetical protein